MTAHTTPTPAPAAGLSDIQRRNIATRLKELKALQTDIDTERRHIDFLLTTDTPAPAGQQATDPDPRAPGCDVCGAGGVLLVHTELVPRPRMADLMCPECARNAVLVKAAEGSLIGLLNPVLSAWAAHWAAVGVPAGELVGAWQYATEYLAVDGQMTHENGVRDAINKILATDAPTSTSN